MDNTPPTSPTFACAPELSRGAGIIIRALIQVIARRFLRLPHLAHLGLPVCGYLNRTINRLQRLLARLAAGPIAPPRPRKPHPHGTSRKGVLPRSRGWLVRVLGWEAAGHASQLEALLAEPEIAALLAQVPAARRLLAPLRRMLTFGPRPPRTSPLVRPAPPPVQSQFMSPEWGRPPEAETWHRWPTGSPKPI